MCAQEEEKTVEAEVNATEWNDETSKVLSPDRIEERIEANFELLNAQISASKQLMDRLIKGNLAREVTIASAARLDSHPNRHWLTDPEPLEPYQLRWWRPRDTRATSLLLLNVLQVLDFSCITWNTNSMPAKDYFHLTLKDVGPWRKRKAKPDLVVAIFCWILPVWTKLINIFLFHLKNFEINNFVSEQQKLSRNRG